MTYAAKMSCSRQRTTPAPVESAHARRMRDRYSLCGAAPISLRRRAVLPLFLHAGCRDIDPLYLGRLGLAVSKSHRPKPGPHVHDAFQHMSTTRPYLWAWTRGRTMMDTTSANIWTETIRLVVSPNATMIHSGASSCMSSCASGASEKPMRKAVRLD